MKLKSKTDQFDSDSDQTSFKLKFQGRFLRGQPISESETKRSINSNRHQFQFSTTENLKIPVTIKI